MKNKYAAIFEKKKAVVESESGNNSKGKYLTFFQPKKELDKGIDKLQIRVLPGDNMFYEEYQRHMFRTPNGQYKIATCLDSVKSNGERYSKDKCPICQFIEDNGRDMKKENREMLYAKSSFVMLVYNKYADDIQKYEVNNFGLLEILGALETLGDDFDPDKNGFDIYIEYEVSSNGKRYVKITGASKPIETIDEIMSKSKNFKERRNVMEETYPDINWAKKNIVSVLTVFVESYEPTFANMLSSYTLDTTSKSEEDSFNFGNNTKDVETDNHEEIIKDDISVSDDDDETLSELRQLMDFDS